jgi:hypothetical protein
MKILKNKAKELPVFMVGQAEAKERVVIAKKKLVKFKAGLEWRQIRDAEKVVSKKNPSKQTPKGTIHIAKPTKRVLAKLAKLAQAA